MVLMQVKDHLVRLVFREGNSLLIPGFYLAIIFTGFFTVFFFTKMTL